MNHLIASLPHPSSVRRIWPVLGYGGYYQTLRPNIGRGFPAQGRRSYAAGHHDGNLFDLLDSTHWMGQHWDLPNDLLPAEFLDLLSRCDQHCSACSVCRDLFKQYARALPIHFETL